MKQGDLVDILVDNCDPSKGVIVKVIGGPGRPENQDQILSRSELLGEYQVLSDGKLRWYWGYDLHKL